MLSPHGRPSGLPFLFAGVKAVVHLTQTLAGDVRVHLRGADAGVAVAPTGSSCSSRFAWGQSPIKVRPLKFPHSGHAMCGWMTSRREQGQIESAGNLIAL